MVSGSGELGVTLGVIAEGVGAVVTPGVVEAGD